MRIAGRFRFLPLVVRLTLILALGVPSLLTAPASAAPPGADLGIASGMRILDASSCGQYMTTQALDSQCNSASANHWIILGWNYNPNACSAQPCAKPDGFNIVRTTGGASSVFTTQAVSPGQTTVFGTILQNIRGDENIGACFSVAPYRGTTDVGRPSNAVCIESVVHLAPTRWGTAHSARYTSAASSCGSPSSNSIGYQLMFMNGGANSGTSLFTGYVQRIGTGNCNRYDDVYQGLVYYDLSKLAGKSVSKATLKLQVVTATYNPGAPGEGNDGKQQRGTMNCAASIGFPTNVNVGSDPGFPSQITYDPFATLNGGAGEVDVDLTGMVRAWLHPGGVNRGIVLSPAQVVTNMYMSTNENIACLSQYREPVLDVDVQ